MTSTLRVLTLLAAAAALPGPAAVAGGSLYCARIERPIVIGDQVFEGGDVALEAAGKEDLLALTIDGRRVALLYAADLRRPQTRPVVLVLKLDSRGLAHLQGYRLAGAHGSGPPSAFRLATVAEGDTTLVPSSPNPRMVAAAVEPADR